MEMLLRLWCNENKIYMTYNEIQSAYDFKYFTKCKGGYKANQLLISKQTFENLPMSEIDYLLIHILNKLGVEK